MKVRSQNLSRRRDGYCCRHRRSGTLTAPLPSTPIALAAPDGSQGPIAWHGLSALECQHRLGVGPDGLDTAESARRLAERGPNRLELSAGRSTVEILWDQFSNVMLIMLLAVAETVTMAAAT